MAASTVYDIASPMLTERGTGWRFFTLFAYPRRIAPYRSVTGCGLRQLRCDAGIGGYLSRVVVHTVVERRQRGVMFRIYSAAKVAQMLSQRDGSVTLKLGRYDGAWRPHPSADRYAPGINGPAEKVTYTLKGNGLVSVDVERRNGPWAFAPPREHSVGPMPTEASVARSHAAHKYVWGALLVYLAAIACGFELGYGPIGGGSLIGGFVGLVLGFFVAYVINLSAVVALHAHQTRARRAQDTVVPHE